MCHPHSEWVSSAQVMYKIIPTDTLKGLSPRWSRSPQVDSENWQLVLEMGLTVEEHVLLRWGPRFCSQHSDDGYNCLSLCFDVPGTRCAHSTCTYIEASAHTHYRSVKGEIEPPQLLLVDLWGGGPGRPSLSFTSLLLLRHVCVKQSLGDMGRVLAFVLKMTELLF